MQGRRAAGLAVLAGLLHTASFSPVEAWWLQPLALALLAGLTWSASPMQAAWRGGLFGFAWLGSGVWWIQVSLHQFGHIPWVLAALAIAMLAVFLACYYAAAMALAAYLRGSSDYRGAAWLIWPACFLAGELARAGLMTGFPWIVSGYAHTLGPLASWAPWIGVYGISALAAACAMALAGLARRCWRPALLMTLLLGLGWLLPQDFTKSTGTLRVSLLQPNVPQDQKFDRDLMEANLDRLATLIESSKGQVVLTPESVVPLPLDYLDEGYLQRLQASAAQRPLLLGVFIGNERDGFVNSLLSFGGSGPYDYGKRHLLPFGEFIPPGFHWFVRAMQIPMDDQGRGQHQRSFPVAGQRLRPLICYEDLFGEDIVDSVNGEDAATVFFNASNLAWFGTVMVQDQHLQFSQMRALEFQRPFVRSTNTGATAVLDHRGGVSARLAPATTGILEAEVEGRSGSTPYARALQAFGLWPFYLALAALLSFALWRRRAS